ncbi:UNVERIFIED_CONTAM: Dicer-like protein 4 [Sesamum radiatum]|uniref:Dicer-like protein 4 n=1 Tax=Sesamum radiatum TaxID=300843 RepID=A0AAW2VNA3_SESRA
MLLTVCLVPAELTDIGSSLSLLPSILHRLESFLVAIELKEKLVASFPEGAEVTAERILEALTTERCYEHFYLERLEVLGDAFLKFAVGRHLFLKHDPLNEGQLTRKRSNIVNNSNLPKLATRNNLQFSGYRHCSKKIYSRNCTWSKLKAMVDKSKEQNCNKETEKTIHPRSYDKKNSANAEVRCNKCHHLLHNKTVADVVEALVGAFIVDSGFKAATAFLNWLGIEVDFTVRRLTISALLARHFCHLLIRWMLMPLKIFYDTSLPIRVCSFRPLFIHLSTIIWEVVTRDLNFLEMLIGLFDHFLSVFGVSELKTRPVNRSKISISTQQYNTSFADVLEDGPFTNLFFEILVFSVKQ